jgi:hypothetical protein
MKKIIFNSNSLSVIFVHETSITNSKLDKGAQVAMKGNWLLVLFLILGLNIKVNSFQIADSQCFEGSTWKLVSNNNKGNMSLTKYGCAPFSSPLLGS